MTIGLLGKNLELNTNFRIAGRKARNRFCVIPVASHPFCTTPFFLSVHFMAVHCLNLPRKDVFRGLSLFLSVFFFFFFPCCQTRAGCAAYRLTFLLRNGTVNVFQDSPTCLNSSLSTNADDMSFDVSWFAVRSFALDREPILLASLDRRGIVTQSRRNGSSDLSLERISPLEFRLRVHGCQDHDFGNHYCVVTPWVRSATGVWQREPDIKAKPIFLSVKMDGKRLKHVFSVYFLTPCYVFLRQTFPMATFKGASGNLVRFCHLFLWLVISDSRFFRAEESVLPKDLIDTRLEHFLS